MNRVSNPIIAVSACLLGQAVRYDGKHKYTSLIAEELAKYCHLIPICPEVEIGLGIPRDKIQLTQVGNEVRVLKVTDRQSDVTHSLTDLAAQFLKQHQLSGLVLQDKSPSCGIENVKLFSEEGVQIGISSGVFAATIRQLQPNLRIVQASQLQSQNDVEVFVSCL